MCLELCQRERGGQTKSPKAEHCEKRNWWAGGLVAWWVGGWWVEWWATSGNLDDKRLWPGGGVDRCPYFPAHVGEKHKQENKRKIPQQTMAYFGSLFYCPQTTLT